MTVQMIATVQRWVGLSTDTKPTGVPIGSEFLEYKTPGVHMLRMTELTGRDLNRGFYGKYQTHNRLKYCS